MFNWGQLLQRSQSGFYIIDNIPSKFSSDISLEAKLLANFSKVFQIAFHNLGGSILCKNA